MPQLPLSAGAVDTITLANSGVTVTMRKFATGRDKTEAYQACVAEGMDPRRNRARFMCHVAASMIVSWDATRPDKDGQPEPLPITADILGAMEDQADYTVLVAAAADRMALREDDPAKEGPFGMSSTPSSPVTSSKTRRNSRRSSPTSN